MITQTADVAPTFTSGLVNDRDLTYFREKGAVCIRNVATKAEVETLRAAAASAVAGSLERRAAAGENIPSGPVMHNLLRVWQGEPTFKDFLLHSRAPAVARDLMQSRTVKVFDDQLLIKEPLANDITPWHHDLPYWPVRGSQICSIWVALDDVTRANGGMEYIAGSHLWGKMYRPKFFNGETFESDMEEIPDFEAQRDQLEILHWELAPGDVLVHFGLTVHGAGHNTRPDLSRRAYIPRYVGDDAYWEPKYMDRKRADPATLKYKSGDKLDDPAIWPLASV